MIQHLRNVCSLIGLLCIAAPFASAAPCASLPDQQQIAFFSDWTATRAFNDGQTANLSFALEQLTQLRDKLNRTTLTKTPSYICIDHFADMPEMVRLRLAIDDPTRFQEVHSVGPKRAHMPATVVDWRSKTMQRIGKDQKLRAEIELGLFRAKREGQKIVRLGIDIASVVFFDVRTINQFVNDFDKQLQALRIKRQPQVRLAAAKEQPADLQAMKKSFMQTILAYRRFNVASDVGDRNYLTKLLRARFK